MAARALTDEPG